MRVVLHFQRLGAAGTKRYVIRSPFIDVDLLSSPAPRVVVHRVPRVFATVTELRNHGVGPLYHVDWWSCRLPSGSLQYGGSGFYELTPPTSAFPPLLVGSLFTWVQARGTKLQPTCNSVVQWHAVAGWLGEPVVTIDYATSSH